MSQSTLDLIQAAAARQKAWTLPFNAVDPSGADDHFLHARNTGTRSLAVVSIEMSSTVAGNVEPFRASGTSSNTPTTDIARSIAGPGGPRPSGIYESGVNLALTVDETIAYYYLIADTPRLVELYHIIPPNTGWALNWEISTGILSGQAIIIELTPDDDPVK